MLFVSDMYQVVIYHRGCADGVTAAWVFWRQLSKEMRGNMSERAGGIYSSDPNLKSGLKSNITSVGSALAMKSAGFDCYFVGVDPNEKIPEELVEGKTVVIVDVDLGNNLVDVVKASKSTRLLEHHVKTYDTIANNPILFTEYKEKFSLNLDSSKRSSGASLAWKEVCSDAIPPFIDCVRISDTYDTPNPSFDAMSIMSYLKHVNTFDNFNAVEDVFVNWNVNYKEYQNKGKILKELSRSFISDFSRRYTLGRLYTLDGNDYTVAMVQTSTRLGDIAMGIRQHLDADLNEKVDFTAAWRYEEENDLVRVSLRSAARGINLSEIASTVIGGMTDPITGKGLGGGHPGAASFSISGADYRTCIAPITKS